MPSTDTVTYAKNTQQIGDAARSVGYSPIGSYGDHIFMDGGVLRALYPETAAMLDIGTTANYIRKLIAKGYIKRLVGTSTTFGSVGVRSYVATGTTQNVGAGEDDLMSYAIPANALASDADSLLILAAGYTTSQGNNGTLKAYFGGTLIGTLLMACDGTPWVSVSWIVRLGAASQVCWNIMVNVLSTGLGSVTYTATAIDETAAITFKHTATATTTGDIIQKVLKAWWSEGSVA